MTKKIKQSLMLVLGGALSLNVVAGSFSALKEAQNKYQMLVDSANQAKQQLVNLKPVQPVTVVDENAKNVLLASELDFIMKPAYHPWPQAPEFQNKRDYTIEMSYLNPEHVEKFSQFADEWTQKGWFVARTERQKSPDLPEYVSRLWVRVVR